MVINLITRESDFEDLLFSFQLALFLVEGVLKIKRLGQFTSQIWNARNSAFGLAIRYHYFRKVFLCVTANYDSWHSLRGEKNIRSMEELETMESH